MWCRCVAGRRDGHKIEKARGNWQPHLLGGLSPPHITISRRFAAVPRTTDNNVTIRKGSIKFRQRAYTGPWLFFLFSSSLDCLPGMSRGRSLTVHKGSTTPIPNRTPHPSAVRGSVYWCRSRPCKAIHIYLFTFRKKFNQIDAYLNKLYNINSYFNDFYIKPDDFHLN